MKKIHHSLLAVVASGMLLASCGGDIKADPLTIKKVADFSQEVKDFTTANGYGNGTPFGVEWNSDEVAVKDNELHLSIHKNDEGKEWPYKGGEYRSTKFYGYGDFAVRMKPSAKEGTCSTFFTYTGKWDSETIHPSTGPMDTRNPDNAEGTHDEIDIEFLGSNTTQVQFNYFKDGKGGKECLYNLGFDASKEWHTYGFRWEPTQITWFVDEKPVYRATEGIPTHPGRIISNFWAGDQDNEGIIKWMGKYDGGETPDAVYQFLSTTAEGKETHKEGEPVDPSGIDYSEWDNVAPIDLQVLNADKEYSVTVADNKRSAEMTYQDLKTCTYKNVVFDIPVANRSSNKVYMEFENKGTSAIYVRGDVNAATKHGAQKITAINTSGTQDDNVAETDTTYGGTKFSIAPGKTSKAVINYEGDPVNLLFMIDSAWTQEVETHSGDLVIKNVKFNHIDKPAPSSSSQSSDPQPTSDPASDPASSTPTGSDPASSDPASQGMQIDFNGNGVYTCVNEPGKTAVTYESVEESHYANMYAPLSGVAQDSNRFSFTFKNNHATDPVKFSLGIGKDMGATGLASSIVEADGVSYDYYEAGDKRAQFTVGAGESRNLVVAIDPTNGIDGIILFANSTWETNPITHTNGNFEILNASFSKAA